ncbi:ERVV1 protein, partial [Piprites chloris]|nr:ERVV1 protein [Piprites chloris]
TGFHSFVRWFLPWLGVSELEKTVGNISFTIECIENHTMHDIITLQEEVSSLSQVVLQNQMALNPLLASQGGVCTVISTSCCVCIDQSGRVSADVQ